MSFWVIRVHKVKGIIDSSMFHTCDLPQCSIIRSPLISDHNRSRQHIVLSTWRSIAVFIYWLTIGTRKTFLVPLSIFPTYRWTVVWLSRLYLAREKRLSSISTTFGTPNSSRLHNLWLLVGTSSIMRSLQSQPCIPAVFVYCEIICNIKEENQINIL
jgi:hypothetical protein